MQAPLLSFAVVRCAHVVDADVSHASPSMLQPPNIPGADSVVAWWGGWTSFHDFYLLTVPPAGAADGELRIHGWVTHGDTNERGYFKQSKDCVVRLLLSGIRRMDLSSQELPAIIFSLHVERVEDGWAVTWDSSYGCEGRVDAAAVSCVVEPGRPG